MNDHLLHECTSLVDTVRLRAIETPEKAICIFIDRDKEQVMTYAALDQQAKAIAATIQAKNIKPGSRVLLLFSSGLPLIQAFFGCLYAGCIAVPIYPPAQEKLAEKAKRIVANAQPALALMSHDHLAKFTTPDAQGIPYFGQIPSLALETIDLLQSNYWHEVMPNGSDLAFLQYTSGSTMHPKGVMVSHLNLLDNLNKIYTAYQMNDETVIFSWLPPHHDMGLIGSILTPIYKGLQIVMMSPFSFLQNPLSWLRNISKYGATISGSPNFAYDYCVKRIREEKKQGLDLSSWQLAFNGAEPVREETMEHFYQAFKNYGFRKEAFYPCYGLAEATLMVSGGIPGIPYQKLNLAKKPYQNQQVQLTTPDDPDSTILVSCGHMIQTVKIVDPETRSSCNPDQVGEVWVHSDSVTQGYWHQEEESDHAFKGKIIGDPSETNYLRTGDLGFIHDGELYVSGRIKDVIILYGKNHYPQDIEFSISHAPLHRALGKCAAFVIQEEHEYKLTLMCEVKNRFMSEEEQENLFHEIFQLIYQIHQLELNSIIFIPLKSIPQTTSGKIRRNFCRTYYLKNQLPVVAAWHLNQIKDEPHAVSGAK